jgi:hypothetical protein
MCKKERGKGYLYKLGIQALLEPRHPRRIEVEPSNSEPPLVTNIRGNVILNFIIYIFQVTRDRMMKEMDEVYPEYGFAQHKGYGTKAHMAAIKEHGVCKEHRWSFSPVKYYPPIPR